jgi:hypothetical protein
MTQFHEGNFDKRVGTMGDEAEGVFEEVCHVNWVRYGLNRPPLKMSMLDERVRYTPDYLTSAAFVEVQGFGRDQTLKLKVSKMSALAWWNVPHPVELFVWDSTNKRHAQFPLAEVQAWFDNLRTVLDRFHDSGAYFAVPAEVVFGDSDA